MSFWCSVISPFVQLTLIFIPYSSLSKRVRLSTLPVFPLNEIEDFLLKRDEFIQKLSAKVFLCSSHARRFFLGRHLTSSGWTGQGKTFAALTHRRHFVCNKRSRRTSSSQCEMIVLDGKQLFLLHLLVKARQNTKFPVDS